MANVRTFYHPHYPDYPVHVAMFKDVSNATFLRSQLLEGNSDFDYAFLDATMILSHTHLLSASFLALHLTLTHRSKSRTPHSELVYRLHPNNNIGESYRKFGISDSTSTLIAVKLGLTPPTKDESNVPTNESVSKHLGENVKGESIDVGEEGERLGDACDVEKVRKVYKVNSSGVGTGRNGEKKGVVNGAGGELDERKELESVVLGIMTIKGS